MAKADEKVYSDEEVTARITELKLEGWYLENGWLRRKYYTDGWPITLMLVNAIAGFLYLPTLSRDEAVVALAGARARHSYVLRSPFDHGYGGGLLTSTRNSFA